MDNETRSAVIYARVSSENDRQDTTRQITDLESYARKENIRIVKIFQEHISGVKKIEERAVLQECLDFCCNNHIDILLLSEISRLGRSILQALRSLERLHEAKVSVFIQNLGIYSLQADGSRHPQARRRGEPAHAVFLEDDNPRALGPDFPLKADCRESSKPAFQCSPGVFAAAFSAQSAHFLAANPARTP